MPMPTFTMNSSGSSIPGLRTVSSSRPQVLQTDPHQSVAISEDYYSLSERASSLGSASHTTLRRYATPDSYRTRRTPSPVMSRSYLPAERSLPQEREQLLSQHDDNGATPAAARNSVHFGEDRVIPMSPGSDISDEPIPREYPTPAATPGVDDSPYIQFAINQLTINGDSPTLGRQNSVTGVNYPNDRLVWDEGLGYFIRSPGSLPATPVQQPPPERPPQPSVDPESFMPADVPDETLLYPTLDFVPTVLRPWALLLIILCSLLMIAGIVFCNVWSQGHEGLWNWDRESGPRYFVFQFLPQILAAIIIIWTFVIQAAVYRTIPFLIMASERQLDRVMHKLPIIPQNFAFPDLSHFRYGEPAIGFSLFVIWLSNLMTMPLISCLFQVKWYTVDGEGLWRWTSVQDVGWTLVAIYGLLTIAFSIIMFRYAFCWSGLMWDPTSLADLISIIQRSNILHDYELSEMFTDVGGPLHPRKLRLGYWKISNRHDLFYGIGETNAPVGNPSLQQSKKSPTQPQGLSMVSIDLERRSCLDEDLFEQHLYSRTARYRWTPWFLRKTVVIGWILTIFALFIAFLLVSFIQDAIKKGFPPRLPTMPNASAFSSSNFLYSFIPCLIGTALFLLWQPVDVYFRALQPFATLSAPEGAPAEKSLLIAYQSNLPFEVSARALLNGHYKVAWISLMSVISVAIPILSGGIFMALVINPHNQVRIDTLMPAFYALIAFCALYAVSFLCIWPGSGRYLPHSVSTLADITSFLYESPLLSDKILREPRSKTDLLTRLIIAPPGEREYPLYGFGIYIGRDGREHLGIDRFHRQGRPDMLITTD